MPSGTTKVLALLILFALGPKATAAQSVSEQIQQLATAQGDDRIRLIDALGKSRSRQAVQPLVEILDPPHVGMRETRFVVIALGEIRDSRAVPALREAWTYFKSNDMGGTQFPVEVVVQYQLVRESIIVALDRIGGDQALDVIESATQDKQKQVVKLACDSLRRLRRAPLPGCSS